MSDAALYSLALENNRLLKALTERMTPKPSQCTAECSDPRGLHAMAGVMGGTDNPHDLTGINSVVRGNPKVYGEFETRPPLKEEIAERYAADVASIRATGEGVRRGPITEPAPQSWDWARENARTGADIRRASWPAGDHVFVTPVQRTYCYRSGSADRYWAPGGEDSSACDWEIIQSKPLPESDMAHVLKTGEVPPAYSTTERLVRGQVADRLWSILGVKTLIDPSLDAALAQAEHVIKYGGVAGATMVLLQSKAHDAALEEVLDLPVMDDLTPHALKLVSDAIRALKSKSAPKECIVPGCVLPPGHVPRSNHRDASGKTWCTDVTDDFISSCKPAPQPSGTSGELPQDKWTCGGCGESGTGFMPGRHEMRWCVEDMKKRAAR